MPRWQDSFTDSYETSQNTLQISTKVTITIRLRRCQMFLYEELARSVVIRDISSQ